MKKRAKEEQEKSTLPTAMRTSKRELTWEKPVSEIHLKAHIGFLSRSLNLLQPLKDDNCSNVKVEWINFRAFACEK